ncbi:HEAT repeat domain-containing protein [Parapedobacter tibetensis]|uniref:HEAT repeat domain-containing protein n=1 Tax=Parapedobacter tibetensis TaxID=2972951 RepID=UPI00214D9944|nr:HEAT repeat domain-containing protein [Parapedobacter tibetensis]
MSDPIKRFVQENREAFDHLEPSAAVLQRIKDQLEHKTVVKKGFFKRHEKAKWLVAASILLGLVFTYTLYDEGKPTDADEPLHLVQKAAPKAADPEPSLAKTTEPPLATQDEAPKRKKRRAVPVYKAPEPLPQALHAQLVDSSSASIRLAAILEIERSGHMNDEILTALSKTIDQDGNSNVRVAALDVLGKYAHEPHIADLLIKSLGTQDDPLMQLSLINLLGGVDNKEVDETLFALTNDPRTFLAVKDEAYTVLLNQNKL